jgi:GT2 family glycosyltransferase/glycosyltransferase involved in cell wall biosynthesis
LARTVLSNAWPSLNPFAGLAGPRSCDLAGCTEAVNQLGAGRLLRHFQWPHHFVALGPAAVAKLSRPAITAADAFAQLEQAGGQLEVADRDFAGDPALPLYAAPRLEAHESMRPPAWGGLSARLQTWLKAGTPGLPAIGDGRRPVTLHVTHSWGGGVSQWVRTFIENDNGSTHLQLRSESPQSGQGHGQRISLYAGNLLDCPLESWWFQPPVLSVDDRNEQYFQILEYVKTRYGVGRLMVSSLVGHSLDALRTGLPTIQVLHDFFPAWPLLSIHPETYIGADGRTDLERALAETRNDSEFHDRSARSWDHIRDAYLAALKEHAVAVTAPSRSVADLQARLDARWNEIDIRIIPHAFPPLENPGPVQARPRLDERLRLVIMGRMQPGKGQALLQKALPRISPFAHVYLVGAGKNGEAFFGIPGVNVLVDYARERLPAILHEIGPHVAALLSVVPETFGYTLSELQYLGVPAIATDVGSFAERIEDGINGWLIEPSPWALADQVEWLHSHPAAIESARLALASVPHAATESMVAAYNELRPAELRESAPPRAEAGMLSAQAASAAFNAALENAAKTRLEEVATNLEREVSRRTEWALDTQGELELARARLEKTLAQRDHVTQELGKTALALEEIRAALDRTLRELKATNRQLESALDLQAQILTSTSWRMTRPLRVLRRLVTNLLRTRAWNPFRWPWLLARFTHNLATLGPRGALMRMQATGQSVASKASRDERAQPVEEARAPTSLPCSSHPTVSIVIPAYNNWKYSAACLLSIAETAGANLLEVILVDDASTDQTQESAAAIEGLRYLRNGENLGFIGSCNRGVEAARGKYTVLLNNDTQVLDGWLEALLDTFARFPEAQLVGARLIYPDGKLQECGGLLFQDGSGWNYGRGDDPNRPEYHFLRETDYCSGACLMVPTRIFRELGGFDTRYDPAYYEDTDLAFRVREAGGKVFVQPRATVIHHEGMTSGTDLNSGTKRFQVANQEKFLERWGDALRGFSPRIEDPSQTSLVRKARDYHLRGRVLIIDATTPEPDQDSGSVRLTQLMGCFRDLGFGVTFFADNRCHAGRYTRELQQSGVEVMYLPWLESPDAFFQERGGEFDYVLISRHYIAVNYIAMVRSHCPKAKLIFDTVDLHYLREQRLAELEGSLVLQQSARQTRRSELSVIKDTDAVLVVSAAEVEVLAADAPGALVHVLSNIHPVPGCRTGFKQRDGIFFVGGYQHPPNIDAMQWFVRDIWPLIRAELPDVRFHMIGSKAPDEIRALAGEGVVFHGFVENLERYLEKCRLAVAPLRYGAGVKGKVNMSMSYGQPVVATPSAVEGLFAEHGREILVADTEQAFAREVVRLYRDEDLWNGISAAAIENVEKHFSVAAARRSIEELLARLG